MRTSFGSWIADAWARGFQRQLRRRCAALTDRRGILERIASSGQTLFDERRGALPDRQAAMITGMCSMVLAAYRELCTALGDRRVAREMVEEVFSRARGAPMKLTARLALRLSRDRFRFVRDATPAPKAAVDVVREDTGRGGPSPQTEPRSS